MDFAQLIKNAEEFLTERNATSQAEQATVEAEPAADQPAVTHSQPILTGGADGEPVKQLVKLLEVCGFANNSIAKGENADGLLDQTVMADVRSFCEKHGIVEDPKVFEGERVAANDIRGNWVGPRIWQALYDEASKVIEGR